MATFNWSTGVPLLVAIIIKFFSLSFLVYRFRPTWLIRIYRRYEKRCAGVSEHHLKVTDGLEISYLEREGENDGQSLLIVHGFTGSKESFTGFAGLLPQHFHILVVDLPGHGQSRPRDAKSDYSIDSQVENLHKFVKAFGFGKRTLNMVGYSMGGHVVGVYAARYGEILSSAVLISPAGVDAPERTRYLVKTVEDLETNALLPRTADEMQEMLKLVIYRDLSLPYHIRRGFVELREERRITYKKVLKDILATEQPLTLNEVLEKIHVPLLCVWGKHDKILHVSGSEVIKNRVKDAEVHILEECGHAVTIDQPRKLLKILVEFLGRINTSQT